MLCTYCMCPDFSYRRYSKPFTQKMSPITGCYQPVESCSTDEFLSPQKRFGASINNLRFNYPSILDYYQLGRPGANINSAGSDFPLLL